MTAPANGSTVSATVSVSGTASDNVGVAGVQFRLDGANLGAEDSTAPYSVSWNTTTAANGAHVLTAVARDAAGNQATSPGVNVTVSNSAAPPPPPPPPPPPNQTAGLVAAYAFNAGAGTTAADASGKQNTGAISGAQWVAQGRYGAALRFDGVNDLVSVADAASLDLTSGMTLEAWVKPTALSGWRSVVMKEVSGGLAYTLVRARQAPKPAAYVRIAGKTASDAASGTAALPLNTWCHLAATYDGATLRIYVNAVQVASQAVTGSIVTSSNPLSVGGNSVWGEYFAGLIDEVRIYGRALTAAEIQTDMSAPIGGATTSARRRRRTSASCSSERQIHVYVFGPVAGSPQGETTGPEDVRPPLASFFFPALVPTRLCGARGNLSTLARGQRLGASATALQATQPSERGRVRVLAARPGRGRQRGDALGRPVAPRAIRVVALGFNQVALPLAHLAAARGDVDRPRHGNNRLVARGDSGGAYCFLHHRTRFPLRGALKRRAR